MQQDRETKREKELEAGKEAESSDQHGLLLVAGGCQSTPKQDKVEGFDPMHCQKQNLAQQHMVVVRINQSLVHVEGSRLEYSLIHGDYRCDLHGSRKYRNRAHYCVAMQWDQSKIRKSVSLYRN